MTQNIHQSIFEERSLIEPIMREGWTEIMMDPTQRESYFRVLELKKHLMTFWPQWKWDNRFIKTQEEIQRLRQFYQEEVENFYEGSQDILEESKLELNYWTEQMNADPSQKRLEDYLENIERCQKKIAENIWLLGGEEGPETIPAAEWRFPKDWKENYFEKYATPDLKCRETLSASPEKKEKRKREDTFELEIHCIPCLLTELYSKKSKTK